MARIKCKVEFGQWFDALPGMQLCVNAGTKFTLSRNLLANKRVSPHMAQLHISGQSILYNHN